MLRLEINDSNNDCLEICVSGQLVYSEAEQFKETILPYLKEQARVKVDCSSLSFLDSAGMGAFVRLWKECKIIGAELEFNNVLEDVKSLLRIARLHQLTKITSKSA